MKKNFDKSFWFLGAGIAVLLLELFALLGGLDGLNVLSYLLYVGIVPAVILCITTFLYSMGAKSPAKLSYVIAVVMALVFSGIMLLYCSAVVTPELVESILANSVTGENTQVSMTTASAGDNIQSILLLTAFAGVGAFIGNSIRKKRASADAVCTDEYDG